MCVCVCVCVLQAEKQVYQLELVNREKNYNQIFSANPCVGVLDPLSSGKVGHTHTHTQTHTRTRTRTRTHIHTHTHTTCRLQKPPAESSSRHSSAPSLDGRRPKLPALVSSPSLAPRLTASDAELSGRSPPVQPRPTHQMSTRSPLLRRTTTNTAY